VAATAGCGKTTRDFTVTSVAPDSSDAGSIEPGSGTAGAAAASTAPEVRAVPPLAPPVDPSVPLVPGPGIVFVAHFGVGLPTFAGVTADGVSAPMQIAPDRGSGYGVGTGRVSTLTHTPDGATVVLELGGALFAVATSGADASHPVQIASLGSAGEHVLSPDGSRLVLSSGSSLYRVSLDGSTADAPVRIAKIGEDERFGQLWWPPTHDRIVFLQRSVETDESFLFSVLTDGSEADAPVRVSPADPGGRHDVHRLLPDGRLLASFGGSALWVVGPAGGAATAITADVPLAPASLHVVDDGARIVARLGESEGPFRLVSFATDGSEADAPVLLTPELTRISDVLIMSDTQTVVLLAEQDSTTTLIETSYVRAESPRTLIAEYSGDIAGASRDGRVLVGCESGNVVRIDRTPGGAASVTVLVPEEDVGSVCSVDGLLGDDDYVAYYGPGGAECVVPVAGGVSTVVAEPGSSSVQVLPGGVFSIRDRLGWDRVYKQSPDGSIAALSVPHPGTIGQAYLPQGSEYVYYRSEARWHAVRVDGADSRSARPIGDAYEELRSSYVASMDSRVLLWRYSTLGGQQEVLMSLGAPGGLPVATELLTVDRRPYLASIDQRSLIVGLDSELLRVPIDGSEPTVVLTGQQLGPWMDPGSFLYDPTRHELLVATRSSTGLQLVAVPPDGSGAISPRVVVQQLPASADALLYALHGPAGGQVLVTTAMDYTALPHPNQVWIVATDGSEDSVTRPLAPAGYLVVPEYPTGTDRDAHVSSDGDWVLLNRGSLPYLARSDGSSADSPIAVFDSESITAYPIGPSPDGSWVLFHVHGDALYRVALDGAIAPVRLTPALEDTPAAVEWLDQAERLVFATTTADGVQLCVARTNGADADGLRPLVTVDQGISGSFALSPDQTRVLFSTTIDGATRLCSAQVDPDVGASPRPVPLTTVTDADERLVGWVQ
jgi:hypothetical protein